MRCGALGRIGGCQGAYEGVPGSLHYTGALRVLIIALRVLIIARRVLIIALRVLIIAGLAD